MIAFGRPHKGLRRGTRWWSVDHFGVVALTFMMAMYGLESRGRTFVLTFTLGCALSGACGSLSTAWPSGALQAVCVVVAVRHW